MYTDIVFSHTSIHIYDRYHKILSGFLTFIRILRYYQDTIRIFDFYQDLPRFVYYTFIIFLTHLYTIFLRIYLIYLYKDTLYLYKELYMDLYMEVLFVQFYTLKL